MIALPDTKPLFVELFAGLHGWGEGAATEGFRVVGFDLFDMCATHGKPRPAGIDLVLQDVLTLHGSQFRAAAVIVASPPCQNYSYLAMPWSRSKPEVCKSCGGKGKYPKIAEALGMEEIPCIRCGGRGEIEHSKAAKALRKKWETEGPDNRLFDACFRIQAEAIEAKRELLGCCVLGCSRCYIPLIVENVRGAQPWVGRSAWNFGSFHLWGDVPALMPINLKRGIKLGGGRSWSDFGKPGYVPFGFNTENEKVFAGTWRDGVKVPGQVHGTEYAFTRTGANGQTVLGTRGDGQKVPAYSDPRRNGGKGVHLTSPQENADGTKIGGDWFSDPKSTCRKHGSRSNARKMASAQIAKIPLELARHIAQVFYPRESLAQGRQPAGAAGRSC